MTIKISSAALVRLRIAFPPKAGKRSLLSSDLEALERLAAYE